MPTLKAIVSGGQTGVDRAALDAARCSGLEARGWCPAGRRAEDGAISPEYLLIETPSRGYRQRTKWNVRDSDATLILYRGEMTGGTALTVKFAAELGRPVLAVELGQADAGAVRRWLGENHVTILNIAGPKETKNPAIYAEAREFLRLVLLAGQA
ncbi:putative molybdenum carrier protein [Nevskia soli]|uniref:putative molybdenum carrier protein n=1 Tax=Nevskia soli TaxID=418856 RepID=UPI00055CF8DD|nr:putative molybdenum carrier protein [Nevskia soli]